MKTKVIKKKKKKRNSFTSGFSFYLFVTGEERDGKREGESFPRHGEARKNENKGKYARNRKREQVARKIRRSTCLDFTITFVPDRR